MELTKFLILLLLAVTTTSMPTNIVDILNSEIYQATGKDRDEVIGLNKALKEMKILYTSQHDIVNIIVPLTRYDESICNKQPPPYTSFFVEADINDKGERDYQGLFVLKNGTATKIVDNGRDATAINDGSKKVYIGASDGIYIYDDIDGTTKKYGKLTDNIIRIEADNKAGIIYFVTNDHQVYSVADEGTRKNKVEDLKDVKDMAIDLSGNFFYYDTKNDLYVYNDDGIKKIEGIPSGSEVRLTTMSATSKKAVAIILALVDNAEYVLKSDGTYEDHIKVSSLGKISAYAPDTGLVQLFAAEKRIIEFNGISPFCAQFNLLMFLSRVHGIH